MDDLRQIFEDALEAEGVNNVEVMHTEGVLSDNFHIKKDIGGDSLHMSQSVSFQEQENWDGEPAQHIAFLAAEVAHSLKERTEERGEWGENVVDIDLLEKNKATCVKCGASATLDNLRTSSFAMAETSVPQPITNTYEDLPKHKRRFALLALLREECKPYCTNSPYDEVNQFHRKI